VGRTFTPVDVPKEALRRLHELLGLTRAVIVQSSSNGTDHAVLLDALAESDGRWRGVALVDAETTSAELAELHAAGVRGFRLNFLPHLPAAAGLRDIRHVFAAAAEHGWHASVHVSGDGILRCAELAEQIPVPLVIDHMARVDLAHGLDSPAVQRLLRLLDGGRTWVKVSGVDRVSRTGPPYLDAVALAAKLVSHNPDRVVWGTDFPHPNIDGDAPDDGLLVDLLEQIAPTEELRRLLLVANPTALYDFDPETEHTT